MKPNILFVIIDSFRADRFFGKQKTANSPSIDSLIKKGVYFSNAITVSDYTFPVIQSIFTSRFPFGCGTTKKKYTKIHSTSTSFLVLLKKYEYHTYAIIEDSLAAHGFEEIFENNDLSFKTTDNLYNGLGKKIMKKLDEIISPWFYYIHFEDLHKPCVVPEELSHLKLTDRYDQNIFEIDSWIKKILGKIDLDKTLIILTSDHGEYISPIEGPLKESSSIKTSIKSSIKKIIPSTLQSNLHEKKRRMIGKIHAAKTNKHHEKRNLAGNRQFQNKMLFDDIVRIPLVFAGYGINSISPISQQVSNIDIFPTILELIGIPNTIQNIHGRSLVPLMNNEKLEPIPVYMESSVVRKDLPNPRPVMGIRTESFKYFRSIKDPKKNVHLYDLKNDPLEDNNIANTRPDVIKEMEQTLENIRKNIISFSSEELDQEQIKRVKESLKKLGYL